MFDKQKISKAFLIKMPCSLRTLVCDQFADFDFKVIAKLANQARIQPLKIISTVSVEIRSRDVQFLTDLIFRDAPFFQNALNIEL
jgi:hypothetical protein